MSYHVLFDLSIGLSKPITVPRGTLENILAHIHWAEQELGLIIEENPQSQSGKKYYRNHQPKEGVSDETFCQVAEKHYQFIRELYQEFADCSQTPCVEGETITPEESEKFWYGLTTIEVPVERWTMEYFRARMEEIYDVLRGNSSLLKSNIFFDSKALTARQAAEVIGVFSAFLDKWDLRLDVPKDRDYLASSYDGGYYWCEKCGAVTEEDAARCRKRGCPIRKEWGE